MTNLEHDLKIDLTPLREAEARALSLVRMAKQVNSSIREVGRDTTSALEGFGIVAYAHRLALLFPELKLEVNAHWSYLASHEVTLQYQVGENGLDGIKGLMRRIRTDGWSRPYLDKNDMRLTWRYRSHKEIEGCLDLRISPGPNAQCEKVVIGSETVEAYDRDITAVRCKGAEAFADLLSQEDKEIKDWEERECEPEGDTETDDE